MCHVSPSSALFPKVRIINDHHNIATTDLSIGHTAVFSSLLNYAAFDMLNSWLVKSFQKDIVHEWVVVPLIIIVALFYGMLASIGCGLAVSTVSSCLVSGTFQKDPTSLLQIIFVGMFYRAVRTFILARRCFLPSRSTTHRASYRVL